MSGEVPPSLALDRSSELLLQSHLEVVSLVDPIVEARGFDPRSVYVEVCWLPVLGPTSTWLYRRLAAWLQVRPEGVRIDLAELSKDLGLGGRVGKYAPLTRSFQRLEHFGVAERQGDVLAVRRRLAPLPERQVSRQSATVQDCHRHALREQAR